MLVLVLWILFGRGEFLATMYLALALWMLVSLPKVIQLIYVLLTSKRFDPLYADNTPKSVVVFTSISVACYFLYVIGLMIWDELTATGEMASVWGLFIVPMTMPFIFVLECLFVYICSRLHEAGREVVKDEGI